MTFYNLNTEFTFGKYKGNTLRQILDIKPSYIEWCAVILEHFYISADVIQELKAIKPSFTILSETQQILDEKYSNWKMKQTSKTHHYKRSSHEEQTNWKYYNDDLDLDQQSIEFWNQF